MNLPVVTLIGTFRKEQEKLLEVYQYLSSHYYLLSPKDINFTNPDVDFVRLPDETDEEVSTIEERVLKSIRESDFVWLFAPDGYVGLSAAFEVGFAHSIGVPVYTDLPLKDEMLETMVLSGVDITQNVSSKIYQPGRAVAGLQAYYKRASRRRGWDDESAKDTLLLITEEMGEVARAVRKHEHMSRDHEYDDREISDELADVQLYLVHLASILSINLGDAVTQKEIKNEQRFQKRKKSSD